MSATLNVTIDSENAAFEQECAPQETARILRKLADEIEHCGSDDHDGNLRDINGNKVGFYDFATSNEEE